MRTEDTMKLSQCRSKEPQRASRKDMVELGGVVCATLCHERQSCHRRRPGGWDVLVLERLSRASNSHTTNTGLESELDSESRLHRQKSHGSSICMNLRLHWGWLGGCELLCYQRLGTPATPRAAGHCLSYWHLVLQGPLYTAAKMRTSNKLYWLPQSITLDSQLLAHRTDLRRLDHPPMSPLAYAERLQ